MNISQAKAIPIPEFLKSAGFTPAKISGANAWYLSPLHSERTPSFKVDTNRNLWYDFALNAGGTIIDLVMMLNNLSVVTEALQVLCSQRPNFPISTWSPTRTNTCPYSDIRELPIQKLPLISYLDSRGISRQTAIEECVELHYTLSGKSCYALGFKNDAGGYELRNPRFKGCISPKDISVRPHCDHSAVAVFEGFFDYLSFMETNHSRTDLQDCIILNSVANIEKAKERLSSYDDIHLFLDNDAAGWSASDKAVQWYGNRVTMLNFLYKDFNDFNEWHIATNTYKNR